MAMFLKKKKKQNSNTMNNEELHNEEIKDQETINDNEEQESAPELTKEEQLEEQVKILNDKHLRLYSEFENFRRRTAKEKIDLIGSASERIMKELLPVIDDFKRAQKSNAESNDINAVKEGVSLVFDKLDRTLVSSGLKQMEAIGEVFDADKHEAITNIPAPSEDMKGKVVDVVEDGYYLNDKIIRFAKVIVGQ